MVGRTPWSARDALVPLFSRRIKPFQNPAGRPGGLAADEGVRPTIYADARLWEKLAALALGVPSELGSDAHLHK